MALAREGTEIVYVSDQAGNSETFEALERSARANAEQWGLDREAVFRIVAHNWGDSFAGCLQQSDCAHSSCFDVIVASDCIYNPKFHRALLESATQLLDPSIGLFVVGFSLHGNIPSEQVLDFFATAATHYKMKIVKELQKDYDSQVGIGRTDAERGAVFVKVLARAESIY